MFVLQVLRNPKTFKRFSFAKMSLVDDDLQGGNDLRQTLKGFTVVNVN